MTKKATLALILAYCMVVICCLNSTVAIIGSLLIIGAVIFGFKDDKITKKVLQPVLMVFTVVLFQGLVQLVFGFIELFFRLAHSSLDFFSALDIIVTIISYIFVIVYIVVGVLAQSVGRNVPIYGRLARSIVDSTSCNKEAEIVAEDTVNTAENNINAENEQNKE